MPYAIWLRINISFSCVSYDFSRASSFSENKRSWFWEFLGHSASSGSLSREPLRTGCNSFPHVLTYQCVLLLYLFFPWGFIELPSKSRSAQWPGFWTLLRGTWTTLEFKIQISSWTNTDKGNSTRTYTVLKSTSKGLASKYTFIQTIWDSSSVWLQCSYWFFSLT